MIRPERILLIRTVRVSLVDAPVLNCRSQLQEYSKPTPVVLAVSKVAKDAVPKG